MLCSSLGVAVILVPMSGCDRAPAAVIQPIVFDHARHAGEEGVACADCHAGADTKVHAGLPSVKMCLTCHRTEQGSHSDEPKVREYAERGEQIPFVQRNRNAAHVYFSHRAHVAAATMDCRECHGDVGQVADSAELSNPELSSMDSCIDCHRAEGASLECAACHK